MNSSYPLIPKQAFLLFPQGKQVILQLKKTHKRMIFGDGRYPLYTDFEKQKIIQFIQLLHKNKQTRSFVDQSQQTLHLKMIYANKFNFENALKNYKEFKQWQHQFMPLTDIDHEYKQKMDDLLKTGLFYATPTRDQYMKPIIIVHVGRLLRIKPQIKLFLDTFGYFLQDIIENMMIDGQLQTWNVIVDVDQTSTFSFAGAVYDLIKFLSKIFIGRMFRCYVVDYPFLIKFVWGTVSLMMDAQQNQKCKILTFQQLLKLLPKEALQQKYGGDLKTLQHFWPLDSPQRIQIQNQSYQKMRNVWSNSLPLVSEKDYYERYQNDKIGNKKCQQIIQKFEIKEQVKLNQLLTNQSNRFQKLEVEQAEELNKKIKIQRQPTLVRVINQLRTSQSLGESPFRNGRGSQRVISMDFHQESITKVGHQDEQFFKQRPKLRQNNIFVRKQIFNQLGYRSLFT